MTDLKAPTTYGPSAILTPANLVTLVRLAVAPVAFAMMLTDSISSGSGIMDYPSQRASAPYGTMANYHPRSSSVILAAAQVSVRYFMGGVSILPWDFHQTKELSWPPGAARSAPMLRAPFG